MPHFTFKNVQKADVLDFSKSISSDLSKIIGCDEDWLYFNHLENTCFVLGEDYTKKCVYVEIGWFDRGDEAKVMVANIVTKAVKEKYPNLAEIIVTFTDYDKYNYVENGERYL